MNNNDDLPLQGPWSRPKGGRPAETVATGAPEAEVLKDKEGKGEERRFREKVREMKPLIPERIVVEQRPETESKAADTAGDLTNDTCCGAKGRNLRHHIYSPGGLYAGVIMAQVLGKRGGRWGTR
ncbi:MAG: hypothetical protein ACYDEQ_11395 [Desulfocucumaceae bacterium]